MQIRGSRVAVVGGDAREHEIIAALRADGAEVAVAARPSGESGAVWHATVGEAMAGAAALILPMPGVDVRGRIYAPLVPDQHMLSESDLAGLLPGAPVFVGIARGILSGAATRIEHPVIELADNDEVAIMNSIPTAEGAVQMAMERRPITIHGSRSVVIGMGRCGLTLAHTLAALGSRVTAVARKPADRARAATLGLAPADYALLPTVLADADFVFNTVPVMVLDNDRLAATKADCLVIDLASAPGGTDFGAAQRLSREAVLAPGLPGKVAPATAGRILAGVIISLLVSGH